MFRSVRLQLRSSAPLGVFVRTRTVRVTLPAAIVVAPRPSVAPAVLHPVPDEHVPAGAALLVHGVGDTVRSVRPYAPGDPARLVHWPTSARRGEIVVREHEPPPALGIAIVVDLRGPAPEAAASRAAGIGTATLAAGGVVWCGTCENGVPVGEMVSDARDLGRRLARADAGALPEPPRRVAAGSGARVNVRRSFAAAAADARRVAPAYRIVAFPAALALGSVGAIAAEHAGYPWIVGALAGGVAAVLGVLALPSIPTRRVTVVLLGLGGLAALRHASFAGADRSWLLVLWAVATMFTLVLVDRADAEAVPALVGGTPLPNRLGETARTGAVIAVAVAVAAVALVPTVTAHLGRHVWPGLQPSASDFDGAASSLKSSDTLDLTTRPRLSNTVVFTVDAADESLLAGGDLRHLPAE